MGNSSSDRRRRQNHREESTGDTCITSSAPLNSETDEDAPPVAPMIRLASHTAVAENKVCCVCSDPVEVGLGHLRLGCRCLLHDDCFVHYIRSKSKFDWIKAGGVRCPYSLAGEGCKFEGPGDYLVTPDELHQLLILVKEVLSEPGSTLDEVQDDHIAEAPITFEEIEKFREWLNEAMQVDTVAPTDIVPQTSDVNSVFIDVTTKACPKCGLRSGHMHGHACHHVTGGCERCGEEYCYRCLSTATDNLATRGDRGKCECGYWHSFCTSDDTILDHLEYEPYPHDTRCGCTICPECRQGDPCPMCDGTCVVCRGYLEHAPSELTELPEWIKQNSKNTINAGSFFIEGATGTRASRVNGVFDLTDEVCNGMPVYRKRNDRDTWMEMVKCNAGGWRWYIKPTKEKGPESSICFAYCSSDDIILPHDVANDQWSVYMGTKFEKKPLRVGLSTNTEIPPAILAMVKERQEEYQVIKDEIANQLIRPAKPGSIIISGAKVDRSKYVNGTFEPVDETCNGMPVYQKKGEPDTWLEMVKCKSGGWRWYVKPTKERGPDISVCFGYGHSDDIVLPENCTFGQWTVYDSNRFVVEEEVTCIPDPAVPPLPAKYVAIVQERMKAYAVEMEALREEKSRPPKPGSVEVKGASADRSKYVNGIFEPTVEVCNGMPVYQRKGDPDTWLEMVKTNAGAWRWYVKPTREKGPDSSVCFGYGSSATVVFPHECTKGGWFCYDDKQFLNEPSITCTLCDPTASLPQDMLDLETSAKSDFESKLAFLEQEKIRDAKEGSLLIEGATADRAMYVNGIFEPTKETCNGMPVYQKKGEPDTWLEVVKTNAGAWRWYVKPTKERGADKSVCYGYGQSQSKGFPQHCRAGEWCCYGSDEFVMESTITCTVFDPKEVHIRNIGAINITGAVGGTGNRAELLNGTFELTEERCNGMPVYRKKGDHGTWLEMVKVKAGGWRWYIKPTIEKGPNSSVCFGYGVSSEIVFPHECDAKKWHCYDGTAFTIEENIVATLAYPKLDLPADILALKTLRAEEFAVEKAKLEQELRRESKPGAIEIKGASADRSKYVNGVFEPTDEVCNGMPVYQKKGDPETWLEMVKTNAGAWRWYVKPTAERGPDKSICFGYGSSEDIVLPQDCIKTGWFVYDNDSFVVEPDISCELVSPNSLPQHIIAMAEEGRKQCLAAQAAKELERKRPPLPGSVIIQGATADRAKFLNGIFEPTDELCNDMPVYRKKGEGGTWLEMVKTGPGWRWYVKPEKERGPDSSICYGYGFHEDKVTPDKCQAGEWCCYAESGFLAEPSITCTIYDASLRLAGAIRISGAVGGDGGSDKARRLNGIFELSTDTCNGMPVYLKEGDPDTCLDMCKTSAGTWRWYVKPIQEKGPNSTVCFGYGISHDVVFPHECDAKKWFCHDGSGFSLEEDITAELLPGAPSIPYFALALKDNRQREWLGKCSAKMEEYMRNSKPASVIIKCSKVDRSKYVNGVFEPTDEVCNGMPVYQKMGDADTWLEMVKTVTGSWRWYVKPTRERGPDNTICFGYGTSNEVVLPQDCDQGGWYIHDGSNFVVEPEVTCELIDPNSVSEFIQELVVTQRIATEMEKEALQMLLNAPPLPGSITIAGATAERSIFVNGNFELTNEVCNGKPVYQKKGDAGTWLEIVKTAAGPWRWYVKPTNARGPDSSVCFGYGTCEVLCDPQECIAWYVYDTTEFVLEAEVTCVLEPLDGGTNDITTVTTSHSDLQEMEENDSNIDNDDGNACDETEDAVEISHISSDRENDEMMRDCPDTPME